jgi:ABC-type nitrate/sulfonate/bicarbonate transport system substrate-binding protein
VAAATGFWNAEAVALRRQGVPIRVFKVDRYGAPPYPELVLATSRRTLQDRPLLVDAMVDATMRGYRFAVGDPARALDDLLASTNGLDPSEQRAQLKALLPDLRPAPLDPAVLRAWASWDLAHGLLERPLDVDRSFRIE